jgi:hypothetical protein
MELLGSWFGFCGPARDDFPKRRTRQSTQEGDGAARLIAFYRDGGDDNRGRTLEDLWEYDYDRLEAEHDYIQWMFPSDEKSIFNPRAPPFPKHVQATFLESPEIRANVRKSFEIYAEFLGFVTIFGRLQRGPDFPSRAENWLRGSMNHNFLRCTRVLKCLWLCGETELARSFLAELEQLAKDGLMRNKKTLEFWRDALPAEEDTAPKPEPEPEPSQAY